MIDYKKKEIKFAKSDSIAKVEYANCITENGFAYIVNSLDGNKGIFTLTVIDIRRKKQSVPVALIANFSPISIEVIENAVEKLISVYKQRQEISVYCNYNEFINNNKNS